MAHAYAGLWAAVCLQKHPIPNLVFPSQPVSLQSPAATNSTAAEIESAGARIPKPAFSCNSTLERPTRYLQFSRKFILFLLAPRSDSTKATSSNELMLLFCNCQSMLWYTKTKVQPQTNPCKTPTQKLLRRLAIPRLRP